MKKKLYIIYILFFLFCCLLPSAGLLFGRHESSSENRTLQELPVLRTEQGVNPAYLTELGAFFEDHFAFRSELVTACDAICAALFGTSAQESVIQGTDGWLYYRDSLPDYQGSEQMTDRQLFNAAHTLAMMQQYAAANGVQFLFAIAPNKNSLYGENMPYYYRYFRTQENNRSRILSWLESEQVAYLDLYSVLEAQPETLYHKSDSHWDNRGASLAADAMLTALAKQHTSYKDHAYAVRRDFSGDLAAMLYPASTPLEEEYYYDPAPQFSYVEEVENNFAPRIQTLAPQSSGSLVMYRDSFGNALLPFLAEAYESTYFSRGIPYYLSDLFTYGADTLIVERAERFLPELACNPPEMAAPLIPYEEWSSMAFSDVISDLSAEDQGLYTAVTGTLANDSYDTDSRIYIKVGGTIVYEAFPVSREDGSEGFQALILTELLQGSEPMYEIEIRRNVL